VRFVREQEDFSVASSQEKGDRSEVFQRWCKEMDHSLSLVELQVHEVRRSLCSRGCSSGWAPKYGQGLATWCVYNNLVCGQNMLRVRRALNDIFDLDVPQPTIFRFKSSLRETLQPIYGRILAHLLKGSLLHIDETEVKLRGCKGYVWVFASMDAVYFEYRDSRKAQFLGPLLEEFQGVLISYSSGEPIFPR